jgi:hypothetical protein
MTPSFTPANRLPVLAVLDPRRHMWRVLGISTIALVAAVLGVRLANVPVWAASWGVLVAMIVALMPKWREDQRRYGHIAMVLGVVTTMQLVRVFEHGVQWFQLHVLRWHMLDAGGLLASADVELLPFLWSWAFLLACLYLVARGMRGPWVWVLLGVALLHALDASYVMLRYQQILLELRALGADEVEAAYLRLPGLFGRDGWLATSELTRSLGLHRVPGLATAPRQDIQFCWVLLELSLLLAAGNAHCTARAATGRG